MQLKINFFAQEAQLCERGAALSEIGLKLSGAAYCFQTLKISEDTFTDCSEGTFKAMVRLLKNKIEKLKPQ